MSAEGLRPQGNRLFLKKSIAQVQYESSAHLLKRSLGKWNLLFLGIGCIIGAGIYVMTGNAAANFAGPAVILSFVVAFFACVFAGLCYAELASTMPVAGSAYTYSYTTLGELFAWVMGWLLVLEYGVAASTVAAGWSGNVVSLLANFGATIPPEWTTSFVQAVQGDGGLTFVSGGGANILGAAGILAVTALLVVGISESASVNNVIVAIKVGRAAAVRRLRRDLHLPAPDSGRRQLDPVHPGQRGRLQIRHARHLPGGLGDLLRLCRLRGRLDRRGRGQEPAEGHSLRHPGFAAGLHASSTC